MQISTRHFLILATTALLFPVFSASVSAQRNPAMTEQQRDADKEAYYAKFLDHKRLPTGEQQRLAYEDAKRYLERFGGDNDANARAVRKFVTEYENFTNEYDIKVNPALNCSISWFAGAGGVPTESTPRDLSLHLTLAVKTSSIRKGRLQPEAESS